MTRASMAACTTASTRKRRRNRDGASAHMCCNIGCARCTGAATLPVGRRRSRSRNITNRRTAKGAEMNKTYDAILAGALYDPFSRRSTCLEGLLRGYVSLGDLDACHQNEN